jgi:hypothetical protein
MQDYYSAADPYLKDYQAKAGAASSMNANAMSLPDMLKSALNKKLADSPAVTERAAAAGNFLGELGNAPNRVTQDNAGGNILDPNQQASLISKYRGTAMTPLLEANDRYDLMSGTIADIINSTTNAYKANASKAGADATLSEKLYKDMLDRITKNEDLKYKYAALDQKGVGSPTEQAKRRNAMIEIKQTRQKILDAKAELERGGEGLLAAGGIGFRSKLPKSLGGISEQTAKLNTALSDVNTRIKQLAGTNVTGREASLYGGLILNPSNRKDVTMATLDQALARLMENENILSSGEYGGMDNYGIPQAESNFNASDWEVVQ